MLSTYQILRQSFETNGSYRTARQPLRDWKFAKSSRVLRKRSRDKPNLRGWVVPHMPTLGPNSRKCWFLCWTNRWCTRRSKFKRRTRFTRRDMNQITVSKFGFCQDRGFLYENFDTECWMLSKTHHETLEFIFGSKIPGHGLRFRMWPGTSPLRLASTHLLGESGKPRISSKTKRAKCFSKMVHRRLLGYNQAGNVSKRLDRLEWTAAYLRNTLSYWIIRSGGAANFIPALTVKKIY